MPTALITGIAGQDGSYLAEFVARKGYRVVGVVRPERIGDQSLDWLREIAELVPGDLSDPPAIRALARSVAPDEIYNLAGVTTLAQASRNPVTNHAVNEAAALALIEVVCEADRGAIRFCQASSSQIFGPPDGRPRDERTPLQPHNDYAFAKAAVTREVRRRREEGWFLCSAILFNHESPRRRPDFVTRRVSQAVARIAAGRQDHVELGSLRAARDWSFAGDVVEAMWMMLQADQPDDYVVASGVCRTVEDLAREAFGVIGISNWEDFVVAGPPSSDDACSPGNARLARTRLGWQPRVGFSELVRMMVDHDVRTETSI